LQGLPYLQTVQDVTNSVTGKGDRLDRTDIHFEPGVFLKVPAHHDKKESICRMASIPHGTTINAQGFVIGPNFTPDTPMGGFKGGPRLDPVDTTPFPIGRPENRLNGTFASMTDSEKDTFRIPQDLTPFINAGTINTAIIKNPVINLENAIKGLDIKETIVFEVRTGPGPPSATLNGGGTANISFLNGKQPEITTAAPGPNDNPVASAVTMRSIFWIERVSYDVIVPRVPTQTTFNKPCLRPVMPPNCTAPTPEFAITTPPGPFAGGKIKVEAIQVQYMQEVLLNFATLTWPHVSVATLIPSGPQAFQMK
jgi:hypothetical protein